MGLARTASAFDKVASIERWKELFPLPKKSYPLPEILEERFADKSTIDPEDKSIQLRKQFKPLDLANATPEEFSKLKQNMKEFRKEFMRLVKEKHYSRKEWPHFFKVITYSNSLHWDRKDFKHPPVYRTRDPEYKEKPVPGRLLQMLPNNQGYSVAIAGFVAYLPNTNIGFYLNDRDRLPVYDFYVLDARVTRDGKPEIIVSMKPPNEQLLNSKSFNMNRFSGRNFFPASRPHTKPIQKLQEISVKDLKAKLFNKD